MKKLKPIYITGIYRTPKNLLPAHMAKLHPDVVEPFYAFVQAVKAAGGRVVVSDMFRSWQMQANAHKAKGKLAVASGTSYHEAGLAFDAALTETGIPYKLFESIAKKHGFESGAGWRKREPWHFQYSWKKLGYRSLTEAIRDVGNLHG